MLRSLGLGDELLRHSNATPERLEWVGRVARTKRDPAAWAAAAIRQGWNPPAVAPGGKGATAKAREVVARLSAEQYAELLAQVRCELPNLKALADDDASVVGAIEKRVNGAAAARRRDDERGQR